MAVGVSRSAYYAARERRPSLHAQKDARLKLLVREIHEKSRRTYGAPRVHAELLARGIRVGKKRVARLMVEEGLRGRVKKRYRVMTVSESEQPVAANVLARDFTAPSPNRRWVSDTTELSAGGTRLFLAAIVDLFSRFVVGWAISTINDRHLVRRALEIAIKRRGPGAGLLCHSDQGSPYTSEDYQRVLGGLGVTVSMSRRGNCHDNAPMESFFSTLKFELGEKFDSVRFAKEGLFDYIELFYNQERRHSALGYVSPAEFEKAARHVRIVG